MNWLDPKDVREWLEPRQPGEQVKFRMQGARWEFVHALAARRKNYLDANGMTLDVANVLEVARLLVEGK